MKSYKVLKELLIERANIRCAMWAAGLITEEQLDIRLGNIALLTNMLETGKEEVYLMPTVDLINPFAVRSRMIPGLLRHLEKSNQDLIEEHFKNEIL